MATRQDGDTAASERGDGGAGLGAQSANAPELLPPPERGFQIRSVGAEIAAGEDVEYCEIGELPGDSDDEYYVGAIELGNADYSHHLVFAAAQPGSEADRVLRELEVGERVRCNGANFEWPQDGLEGIASSQTPYLELRFPEGVGTVLHGKQRVVFDYHYVNASEQPIRAQSAINLHTIDGDALEHVATAFSFFNFTLDIPPGTSETYTAECHFEQDVVVSGLVRHTHQFGRDFSVWFSGGPDDGQHIWTSEDWKHDVGFDFAEPRAMKAGEGFRFSCAYDNPTDTRIRYGIRGSDEMCILAGWVWGAGDARELPPQSCEITWVDADGIGHPASEAGGFPPADEQDAALCLAGAQLLGSDALGGEPLPIAPDCEQCVCEACGSVLMDCATDSDCLALMTCLGQDCGGQSDCVKACEEPLHDHSSAIGMLQQVNSCLGSRCEGCTPFGQ